MKFYPIHSDIDLSISSQSSLFIPLWKIKKRRAEVKEMGTSERLI